MNDRIAELEKKVTELLRLCQLKDMEIDRLKNNNRVLENRLSDLAWSVDTRQMGA